MKFAIAPLATAMLAGTALAAPSPGLAERLEQRGILQRSSQPASRFDNSDKENGILLKEGSDGSKVQYSSNWAGVVRESPPASATYTAVSATFTVPEPTATDNSGDMQAASVWVGIDGDTHSQAILQTGIDSYIQNGEVSFDAWYEWYPDSAVNFDIGLSAGDVIVASVKSFSPSKGVATIENKSSGKIATQNLTAPSSGSTLGGQNAEWIVEDFNAGTSQVPFADFGTVTFSGAQAETASGAYGVNDAAVLDLQQGGKLLAAVKIASDTEFTVTYQ